MQSFSDVEVASHQHIEKKAGTTGGQVGKLPN